MNKYITEFIGTFFLVLTVGVAGVLGSAGNFAPLAIGSVLMVMIFAGGHISGGHYNPAVTLAVFLRGRCPVSDVAPYIIAQLIGAGIAALSVTRFFLVAVVGEGGSIRPMEFEVGRAVIAAEFLFTYALAYTVLNVATAKGNKDNSFYGLAIGFMVMVGAFTVGEVSLGGFNPAVSTGFIIMGKLSIGDSWLHFVPQLVAGGLAASTFKVLNPADE